jgi:hypothetical protein
MRQQRNHDPRWIGGVPQATYENEAHHVLKADSPRRVTVILLGKGVGVIDAFLSQSPESSSHLTHHTPGWDGGA